VALYKVVILAGKRGF